MSIEAMTKHTPGPWTAFIRGRGRTIAVDIGPTPVGKTPCIINWPGFDASDLPVSEQIGNAHLIAASPDLLAALKDMTPPMPPPDAKCHLGIVPQSECAHCKRIAKAHAAIAKAKGESK